MEWERLEQSRTLENYNNLLAACLSVGLCEYGYTSFQEALEIFLGGPPAVLPSEMTVLFTLGGDICKKLGRYEEAFSHWNRALKMGFPSIDALYSIALCHRELSHYREEAEAWRSIILRLEEMGDAEEARWPREMLAEAIKKQRSA